MSDYVLDLIEFDGDVFVDGPLAQNGIYLDLLSALRPGRRILASRGSGAVAAAAHLCGTAVSGHDYASAAGRLGPLPLAEYRGMWREAVAKHCRAGTGPAGPP
jgi:hypothetical protein